MSKYIYINHFSRSTESIHQKLSIGMGKG